MAAGWSVVVPAVALATAAPASATTYPDVAAEPVPFGAAGSFGSMAGVTLNAPVVGMTATPDGEGYWMVAADGGVFAFGDAGSYGSMGGAHLAQPVVGMATTPDGKGYWLAAADGGVFAFGDAGFHGSMGGTTLNQPIVGIAATPSGDGYWLVAADGGVFAFGDAAYLGSMGGTHLSGPIVGMAATPSGGGYWLAGSDGGVFAFGNAGFFGSMGSQQLQNPVTAMAVAPGGGGYWLLPTTPKPPVTFGPGATGPAVLAVQERLSSLGYWLGTPDGIFGDATEQAVWALQKAAGIPRTGVVDAATQAALAAGVLPQPRSTSGYVIEVNLARDLVLFVDNGKLEYVLNTSTGGGYTYTDDGVTSVAETPQGHFQIYRAVDGLVVDSLGALWRPRFFTGGFAIHGDSYVPAVPVSHGCVRVSDEAIDWIWANNLAPIGTSFWVY